MFNHIAPQHLVEFQKGEEMSDIELLKARISESGIPMVTVAKRAKISRVTLYNRLKGSGEFTAPEIVGLTNALKLSRAEREKIFFNRGSM